MKSKRSSGLGRETQPAPLDDCLYQHFPFFLHHLNGKFDNQDGVLAESPMVVSKPTWKWTRHY
ncbi:hypothetical protein ACLK19_23675 [Escherichia coli]